MYNLFTYVMRYIYYIYNTFMYFYLYLCIPLFHYFPPIQTPQKLRSGRPGPPPRSKAALAEDVCPVCRVCRICCVCEQTIRGRIALPRAPPLPSICSHGLLPWQSTCYNIYCVIEYIYIYI